LSVADTVFPDSDTCQQCANLSSPCLQNCPDKIIHITIKHENAVVDSFQKLHFKEQLRQAKWSQCHSRVMVGKIPTL